MTADEATPRGENEKPDVPANAEQTPKKRTITSFDIKKLLEAAIVLMREIKIQSNLGNLADTHSDPHIWGFRLGRCNEAATVFCTMYNNVFGKYEKKEVAAQEQNAANASLKIPDGKEDIGYQPPPPPPQSEPASEPSDSSGSPDANTVQQTSSASDTPPPTPPSSQPNLTVTQSRIGGKKRKEAQAQMFFDSSTGHVTDHP